MYKKRNVEFGEKDGNKLRWRIVWKINLNIQKVKKEV